MSPCSAAPHRAHYVALLRCSAFPGREDAPHLLAGHGRPSLAFNVRLVNGLSLDGKTALLRFPWTGRRSAPSRYLSLSLNGKTLFLCKRRTAMTGNSNPPINVT